MSDVKFIRVNGRVVPVKAKASMPGKKGFTMYSEAPRTYEGDLAANNVKTKASKFANKLGKKNKSVWSAKVSKSAFSSKSKMLFGAGAALVTGAAILSYVNKDKTGV